MKMPETLEEKFNDQITLEFEASLVYRQLAIEMELRDLPGIAHWLRAQSEEEITHAHKWIDHLTDRDNHPKIGAVPAPKVEVATVLDAFEIALQHEQRVSEAIRDLYRAAMDDIDSKQLIQWFAGEQVEEEATVSEIVGRLKLIDNDGPGLLRIDTELASRAGGGA
ncbi:ferritin [Tsukamurella sp. 8F]|uniref:ferritin n=1 Tax=unclassified Tsukamurella TaxID=2633480 RepID=UPI0023B90460|nr:MULTISPECIES: ferritin [unclassified Tsukamurella]MDF0532610.1 ferritin [Tsukamurella sp. 8J]MDF0589143.1 ferritin [Tsukamurella sp. 8F]